MEIHGIGFSGHTLPVEGLFFLFAIIVVVAYHVILIVLWAAPMTTRMQKQFFLTAQVLNAWSLASTLRDSNCHILVGGDWNITFIFPYVGNKKHPN